MLEDELKNVEADYKEILASTGESYDIVGRNKQLRKQLQLLVDAKETLEIQIQNFNYSIDQLTGRLKNIEWEVIGDIVDSGKPARILLRNVKAAVNINTEFNHRFFTSGIRTACKNPNTILLSPSPNRLGVYVNINLNETAGSIEDWANAVRSVRQSFVKEGGEKKERNLQEEYDAYEMRNRFWEEKFYKPAREGASVTRRKFNRKTKKYETVDITEKQIRKYWSTMHKRLEASGKLAPYWEILDKGSVVMAGGGRAYPVARPTYFVEKTRMEIKRLYNQLYIKKSRAIREGIDQIKEAKKPAIDDLRAVKKEIEFYKSSLVKVAKTPELLFFARVKGQAERSGKSYSKIKLVKILAALKAGDVSGLRITAEGRIELTVRGGGGRFRVSISNIISEFGL